MSLNSTQRFTRRVENYTRYRPGYPVAVINLLKEKCKLKPGSVVADVGSGTGIFTAQLLEQGYTVYAVEPNAAMRYVATFELGKHPGYHEIDALAEETSLPDNSVDLVVSAQAFHWFDAARTKVEFARILKPQGKVALIWNNRQVEADEFSIAYELLLQQEGDDYKRVNHQNLTEANYVAFFKGGEYELTRFYNHQLLDEAGLIGRAMSSSYVPTEDTPEGQKFLEDLKSIFQTHQEDGKVKLSYQTEVYLGEV